MSREGREIKIFKASVPDEGSEPQPYPFALQFLVIDEHGVPTGDTEQHTFEASAYPGAGADFAASEIVKWDKETGLRGVDLNGIKVFLARVLSTEDLSRLAALLDRKDVAIEFTVLADVYKWLVEEYGARPTMQSSRSSNGRRRTGKPSTEPVSLAAVST